MLRQLTFLTAFLAVALAASMPVYGTVVTFDFETEDDLLTPLAHGQIVDPLFDAPGANEFGKAVFNLSSTQDGSGSGHLGVTVFDSDLDDTLDEDLEVDTGNILILQNDSHPDRTGDFYDDPNDEATLADAGSIVFDFLFPLVPLSIDLVDANGGYYGLISLRDIEGYERVYTVPSEWTLDGGFATVDLTTLDPQPGVLSTITSVEDAGFDGLNVVQLKVSLIGASPSGTSSGGVDTLVVEIPEPTTAMLLLAASTCFAASKRHQA